VGCGTRRPEGARGSALAKDVPAFSMDCDKKFLNRLRISCVVSITTVAT